MERIHGVVAAVATPLLVDRHEIDNPGLIAHCRRLFDLGCDGINLLGTTGEATSFSVDQRLATMSAVAQSGLPLDRFMVGTGAAAFADAVRLSAHARDLGFAGALVLPPFYFKGIESEGLLRFFDALVATVGPRGLSLYLYNFPQNTGVPYEPDVVAELRHRFPEIVVGLKDSSGNLDYASGLTRVLPGFDVFPSAEGTLANAEALGFAGCISATLNVTAPLVREAMSEIRRGPSAALDKAVRIRGALSRFPLVSAIKWALSELTGQPLWECTVPPLRHLSGPEKSELQHALDGNGFGELQSQFGGSRPVAA
jgi:4-hydroxy-tetrahydrodipicolinate synthase